MNKVRLTGYVAVDPIFLGAVPTFTVTFAMVTPSFATSVSSGEPSYDFHVIRAEEDAARIAVQFRREDAVEIEGALYDEDLPEGRPGTPATWIDASRLRLAPVDVPRPYRSPLPSEPAEFLADSEVTPHGPVPKDPFFGRTAAKLPPADLLFRDHPSWGVNEVRLAGRVLDRPRLRRGSSTPTAYFTVATPAVPGLHGRLARFERHLILADPRRAPELSALHRGQPVRIRGFLRPCYVDHERSRYMVVPVHLLSLELDSAAVPPGWPHPRLPPAPKRYGLLELLSA